MRKESLSRLSATSMSLPTTDMILPSGVELKRAIGAKNRRSSAA